MGISGIPVIRSGILVQNIIDIIKTRCYKPPWMYPFHCTPRHPRRRR